MPGSHGFIVIALACGVAACAGEMQGEADRPPAVRPGPAGPPVGTMPSNASRITATVRGRTVWPPGSLAGVRPAVRPDRTLYSLTLEVVASVPAAPNVENMVRPGGVIEAFSSEPLSADLMGTTVNALVELTGTTEGTRWMVSEITPRP
jgi:hypothetical protein